MKTSAASSSSSSSSSSIPAANGMSRAAKKRRKDKGKTLGGKEGVSDHVPDGLDNDDNPVTKKVKIVTMDELVNKDLTMDMVSKDALRLDLSLTDILALVDVTDIDCRTRAASLFSVLLSPYDRKTFYAQHWEKRPLHCKRNNELDKRKSIKGMLSIKQYREIIRSQLVTYDVDVQTSKERTTTKGQKKTAKNTVEDEEEEHEEAKESELWALFRDGYTIRLLCPQKFHDPIWKLLSALEFEFNSKVGCYADYTPPNCTGKVFPAQMDTFDSLVIQLEGQSRWYLTPPNDNNTADNGNVESDQGTGVDAKLQPGDCLYIPNGWYHRQENYTVHPSSSSSSSSSSSTEGSLNLRVHFNDTDVTSMATLVDTVLPEAMTEAYLLHPTMKRSRPRGVFSYMGVAASEKDDDPLRIQFHDLTRSLLHNVVDRAMNMLDAVTDQAAKDFIHARLPIPLSVTEEERTAAGAPSAIIYPYTRLRMLRPGIARALVEDGMVVVYHCMDNARETYGAPLQPLEFELDDGPAIETLLLAYPLAVTVGDLSHPSEEMEDKVSLAQALYKEGFLYIDDEASRPENSEDEDDDSPF